jgi:tryptophan 2,3-dioxygenase
LIEVFHEIYENPHRYWDAYEMCEKLVDVEEYFLLWRFRHMKTVERIIGFRPGTGGSSGVGFLKQALELTFFPELFSVRTRLHRRGPAVQRDAGPAVQADALRAKATAKDRT